MPLYAVYEGVDRVDALEDQRLAAALMMGEGTVLFLALAVWLGAAALRDAEQRESLIESGIEPRRAGQAVRSDDERARGRDLGNRHRHRRRLGLVRVRK